MDKKWTLALLPVAVVCLVVTGCDDTPQSTPTPTEATIELSPPKENSIGDLKIAEPTITPPVDTASLPEDTEYIDLYPGSASDIDVAVGGANLLTCSNSATMQTIRADRVMPSKGQEDWSYVGTTESGGLVAERERAGSLVRSVVARDDMVGHPSNAMATTFVVRSPDGQPIKMANFCRA